MLTIEITQEEDGRWLGEVSALPGALAYGATRDEARTRTEALALRVLAERIEHGEPIPAEAEPIFAAAWATGPQPKRGASWPHLNG